ncbi:MAG TPA: phosphoribosylanthranilate isomerase [Burkholderiaceae bacterium]
MNRTRIKICGLTREQDLQAAIAAGADAVGFVFYGPSPRYLAPEAAGRLLARVPPFVSTVGLFVNAAVEEVVAALAAAPVSLLQFHGDETLEQCVAVAQAVRRPFLRAIRVKSGMQPPDLLEYDHAYRAASPLFAGLLLDAFVDGYGGGGKVFDWSLIPKELAPRVVLSGGLSELNVTEAVAGLRPYAVDVSSGVEASKGIKDAARIRAFVAGVNAADATIQQ